MSKKGGAKGKPAPAGFDAKKYERPGLSVDEVLAIRTAGTAGQTPYSIFSQIIKNKANSLTRCKSLYSIFDYFFHTPSPRKKV